MITSSILQLGVFYCRSVSHSNNDSCKEYWANGVIRLDLHQLINVIHSGGEYLFGCLGNSVQCQRDWGRYYATRTATLCWGSELSVCTPKEIAPFVRGSILFTVSFQLQQVDRVSQQKSACIMNVFSNCTFLVKWAFEYYSVVLVLMTVLWTSSRQTETAQEKGTNLGRTFVCFYMPSYQFRVSLTLIVAVNL